MKILKLFLTLLFPLTAFCQESVQKPVPEIFDIWAWTTSLQQESSNSENSHSLKIPTKGTISVTDSTVVIALRKLETMTYKIIEYKNVVRRKNEAVLIRVTDDDKEGEFAITHAKKESRGGAIFFRSPKGKTPVYFFK